MRTAVFAMGLACSSLASSLAHPISMTSAEADVLKDRIAVTLSVMLEDLVLFHGLKPDPLANYSAAELSQAALVHGQFLLKYFSVRDSEGSRLTGVISDIDHSVITDGDDVPQSELMKRQIVYAIDYLVAQPPQFLTFMQTFGADESLVPAIMDFNVLQSGIWLDKPLQLMAGQPHTVAFDWENPPDRPAANWRELRAKREAEYQERLGITSYTGLYSYIYVTDREVRHEILMPLLTFERWRTIDRANPDFVRVEEQDAAHAVIAAFFRDRNPVHINGTVVKPTLDRLQFFGLDIKDFALNAPPRRVSVHQARLGIILSYRPNDAPQEVRMTWDTFSEDAAFLRSAIYAGAEDPSEHFFVRDGSAWEWTAEPEALCSLLPALDLPMPPSTPEGHLTVVGLIACLMIVPWLFATIRLRRPYVGLVGSMSMAIIAAMSWPHKPASLPEPQALLVGSTLLQRLYRAFDYRTDEEVYDALAESVQGTLLDEMYTEIYTGLRMEEQGGAKAQLEELKITGDSLAESRPTDSAFVYHCCWQVTGTVEHWGHIHKRVNLYEADFTIRAVGGTWRITDFTLTDERRQRFETGIRGSARAAPEST